MRTLYKRTSTGAIQFWKIDVQDRGGDLGSYIWTNYGQLNTDSPQETKDLIKTGKNPGKANETSAFEQATKEAEAQWTKKKKKGYNETIELARDEIVDTKLIKGGIDPMLAHKYVDHAHKITFPCFGQPKLDGIRCIAVIESGVCTLWTRTRKPINCLPHIVKALEDWCNGTDIMLDGELYNHEYKDRFSEIVSMVRQKDKVHPNHTEVQYHVYDVINGMTFCDRDRHIPASFGPVQAVHTIILKDAQAVQDALWMWQQAGYEGAMLRNSDSLYKNKRSYDLQKVKTFDTDEFVIVAVEEGRGIFDNIKKYLSI